MYVRNRQNTSPPPPLHAIVRIWLDQDYQVYTKKTSYRGCLNRYVFIVKIGDLISQKFRPRKRIKS